MPAEFRYAARDPYAVRLALGAPTTPSVDWFFARSLLAQGSHGPSGIGDVLVAPSRHHRRPTVRITLRTRAGSAVLEVEASAVSAFLRQTDAMVPPGTEPLHLDLDHVVSRLTADSG
ncbi:SsgA family sporulation/cell division regulator [Streptomyces sp. ISL-36]|uniref:SsgA family sporulation/cell division regulator n=1 Tax=Streptomyces sp. ISL-36 TaxID=2819182 RepID=UPI00203531AF|nr:SsgA family sporulation/cell division regulator [Streptomyces sp. ISL-36]